MADSDVLGAAPRRSMLAGSVSLALHGGLVVLAVVAAAEHVVHAPRTALTTIEVFDPAPIATPSPPPAQPPIVQPAPRAAAGSLGHRGHDPTPRVQPRATSDTAPELKVSYDDPSNFAAPATETASAGGDHAGPSAGLGAARTGPLDDRIASLQIPQSAAVSLAAAPHPRRNYHDLRLRAVRAFAGQRIKVQLSIDATGKVTDVALIHGVEPQLDQRTINLARAFEFEPARDATGTPIPGTSNWEILIVDDSNPGLHSAIGRGYY